VTVIRPCTHQQAHTFDPEDPPVIQEPIQPTLTPNPAPRAGRTSGMRIGLVIAACLLLAIPVVMTMAANSSPSNQALGAGASAAPNATGHGGPPKGEKNAKGPGKGPIKIHAISASQISLATEDGWTRTITATGNTVITKGGQTIKVGDLKVGDEIHFKQTRNADGSYTITAIDVPTPKAGGEVTAVDGNTITVKHKDGTTRVITVTISTVYTVGPNAGSKSDVKVGGDIDALGTISGDTFTATAVKVKLPHVGGEVTAKTSDSITVKDHDGTTKTIHVTGSTTYQVKGQATGSLSDIAVGERVNAEGTLRSDGSLDAVAVHGGPH
jgi:hypothetical protein